MVHITGFDRIMSAVTFAESGERIGALDILYDKPKQNSNWNKAFIYGLLTTGLYTTIFKNETLIMKYFTLGGWYSILPITTVLGLSLIHGSFANYLWSVLGIEASKKKTITKSKKIKSVKQSRLNLHI